MNLSNQTIEKVRLILDKPPAPLTFKQITDLVSRLTAPLEQLTLLFVNKYRADLLIFVLQKYTLTLECLEAIIASVSKNLLKYSLQDIKAIWKLILVKEVSKLSRQKWGTERPMQDAFKITNEYEKEMLFELLSSNVSLLLELGEIRAVEEFVKKYANNFIKYNVYLTPVPALASQCLAINTKAQIKLLDSTLKKAMLQRTIALLNATNQRKLYNYQNNCMSLVCSLLSEPGECFADLLDIHQSEKTLEYYLWNKPTREWARRMQQAIDLTRQKIVREEKNKMEYRGQIKEKVPINVPLIQNVIDKANAYRLKQEIGIAYEKQEQSHSRPKSSNFLKKGLGNGGGKAQITAYKSPTKYSKIIAIEQIVQNCFTQNPQNKSVLTVNSKSSISKSNQNSKLKNHKEKQNTNYEEDTISVYSSNIQEGQQWTEISNLIDLAYQYKFG